MALLVIRRDAFGWFFLALFTGALLFALSRAAVVQVSTRLSGAVSGRRVVIDPGHGGIDPGAIGRRTKMREKDLALAIGLHLRRLLGRAGVYVVMLREEDCDFGGGGGSLLTRKRRDLDYRVRTANEARADIYLALHANSFPDGRYGGAQVFYNPARRHAGDLAHSIQASMAASLGPNYRLTKPGDFRVLNDTTMPAVMIEVGFLSNPQDEANLVTDEFQRRVAESIYEGVIHYFLLIADHREIAPTMTVPYAGRL